MIGRLVSFWESLLAGAMLVQGVQYTPWKINIYILPSLMIWKMHHTVYISGFKKWRQFWVSIRAISAGYIPSKNDRATSLHLFKWIFTRFVL